jgi:predicted RNA-binding protein with PUA-like domain
MPADVAAWLRTQDLYCAGTLIYNHCVGRMISMATRWLFKTEPSVYSYQQLVQDKKTRWDGVANNLALKNLKDIKKGEQIFIYHTGDEKAAVGVAKALGGAYSDPEKDKPNLLVVDIEAVRALPRPVTLGEVKAHAKLKNFDLVRNSRLSIMKVTDEQWEIMEDMAKK